MLPFLEVAIDVEVAVDIDIPVDIDVDVTMMPVDIVPDFAAH